MRLPIPEQPWQSSSCTTQPVRTSVIPPPPSSSGSMNEVSPSAAALWKTSHGVSMSASSTAGEIGRISRAAKSRQTRRISSCSGVRSNGVPAVGVLAMGGTVPAVSRGGVARSR